MPAGPSRSAMSPAAARTPTWRMPPPTSLRARRARQMSLVEPTTTEPTGQARPFERQKLAESADASSVATGVPSATDALKMRAPSTCSGHAVARARRGRTASTYSGGERLAHRVRMRVLERRRARSVARARRAGCETRRGWRRGPSGRPRPRPGSASPAPTTTAWLPASCANSVIALAGDDLAAARHLGHMDDEVAHRAAGDEERASLPVSSAARSSSAMTVGSSPKTSSPSSASAMARRISARRLGDGVGAQVDQVGHAPRIGAVRTRPSSTGILHGSLLGTRGVAAKHASLSRWRSPVRIRSGPPVPHALRWGR